MTGKKLSFKVYDQESITKWKNTVDNLPFEISAVTKKIQDDQVLFDLHTRKLDELQNGELGAVEKLIEKINAQIQVLILPEQIESLKQGLPLLNENISNEEKALNELKPIIAGFDHKIAELERHIEIIELEELISKCEAENSERNKQIDSLQLSLNTSDLLYSEARSYLSGLESLLPSLTSEKHVQQQKLLQEKIHLQQLQQRLQELLQQRQLQQQQLQQQQTIVTSSISNGGITSSNSSGGVTSSNSSGGVTSSISNGGITSSNSSDVVTSSISNGHINNHSSAISNTDVYSNSGAHIEQEISQLRFDIDVSTKLKKQFNKLIDDINKQISDLDIKIDNATLNKESIYKQVEDLKKQISIKKREISTANYEIETTQSKLHGFDAQERKLAHCENKEQLKSDVTDEARKKSPYAMQRKEIETRFNKYKSDLSGLQNKISGLNGNLEYYSQRNGEFANVNNVSQLRHDLAAQRKVESPLLNKKKVKYKLTLMMQIKR